MFDNEVKPSAPKAIEDIFAPSEPAAGQPIELRPPQPIQPLSAPPAAPPMPQVLPTNQALMEAEPSGRRPWLMIGGVAIVVVLLGAAGYWWFALRSAAPAPIGESVVNSPGPGSAQPVTPTVPAEVDTDGDGLSDAEEQQLGTNPSSVDSDQDGLFDREEARVYHTNPLDPDSDDDGFTDGQEVQNGFNPTGPGKLLELPVSP